MNTFVQIKEPNHKPFLPARCAFWDARHIGTKSRVPRPPETHEQRMAREQRAKARKLREEWKQRFDAL